MQMHAITKHILVAIVYFASGFTFKELLSFSVRKIHMWLERRIDNRVVDYLVGEALLQPHTVVPDKRGYMPAPHYVSTIAIAQIVKRSAVDTRKRLERLETENRVERPGPMADVWIATKYEIHDKSKTNKVSPVTAPPP
jgi:hypothetical protein